MRVINRANLSSKTIIELEKEIPIHESLMEVYGFYRNRASDTALSKAVPEIINQDEFSIDVIFPWYDNLIIVYGTT
jgi:hypothetical protein